MIDAIAVPQTNGDHLVRCGNPACRTRKYGRPLTGAKVLCRVVSVSGVRVLMRCMRCGEINCVLAGRVDRDAAAAVG